MTFERPRHYGVGRPSLYPTEGYILVRPDETPEKTKGGIFIPDCAKEVSRRGTVVAVGLGRLLRDDRHGTVPVKVGDRLLYTAYDVDKVEVNNQEYQFIREPNIFLVNDKPIGGNLLIIKDQDVKVSAGGIVIPDKAQDYRRRGWVLAVGGGTTTRDGKVVPPPFKRGDYLFADRKFMRPDEKEDEVFEGLPILFVRDDEYWGFIRAENCDGAFRLPEKHKELMESFGSTGDKEQGSARKGKVRG